MIIIDTNVLLAFLLTDGITRKIITENPDIFMSPDHCYDELWEHRNRWNNNRLQDNELIEIIADVKKLFVKVISPEVYNPYVLEGEKLTVDKDDAPVIALALSIDNDGIWTFNTKHFRQKICGDRIKVLSPKDVIKLVSFD
jgi:predicted nucleic acid-binding protein